MYFSAEQLNNIQLNGVFFVDEIYSRQHAHMVHRHEGILELLYISKGEGRYIVGNRGYVISEGDLVICNAGTFHGEAPFSKHPIETYCIALSGVKTNKLDLGCLIKTEQRPVLALNEMASVISQSMKNIYKLFTETKDNLPICRQFSLGVLMIIQKLIFEHIYQGNIASEQKNEYLIRKITQYLNNNYTKQLTLKKISQEMHISETYLSHLFKRETGLSPIQYVIHCRIGEAQSLLMETQLPIYEIEERLGFGSSCHLTTMFKKYVGISPREYRKHFITEKNKKEITD